MANNEIDEVGFCTNPLKWNDSVVVQFVEFILLTVSRLLHLFFDLTLHLKILQHLPLCLHHDRRWNGICCTTIFTVDGI
jgi:hypothetical protein